jgi:putative hydrolase of the HAD superfamily
MGERAWIFDLDNTLHDARVHVFPQINRAMTAYLVRHLGLEEDAAAELRRRYWKRYGATLLGLMRHHGTDPAHFLRSTHELPGLERMLVREPGLRALLQRLPGRKFVFSNSPVRYAQAVLAALRIADLFDGVFSIEHARYRPKPAVEGFLRLCRAHHVRPRGCIMVEDAVENLRTAARLGMRTVWVSPRGKPPPFVDLRISSLTELPRVLSRLA